MPISASRQLTFGAALLALAVAGSAQAAKPKDAPARAAVVSAIIDCRKVTEDAARLACYDSAASAFDQAQTKGEVVVIDKAQARAVRRDTFGFSLPSFHFFEAVKGDEPLDNITVEVERAGRTPYGKWIVVTAEGATWEQTDDSELLRDPQKGSKLLIRKGALGAYMCRVDKEQAFKCARRG